MRNNKKGFTLIELLAVIVILAVVMLIAVSAVGPLMAKSRKGALETEGIALSNAAKTAFQAEQLNASSVIKPTSAVCFDLEFLYNQNYYEKGKDDGYTGSVLVTYDSSTRKYEYTIWISNGTYYIFNKKPDGINIEKDVLDKDGYDNVNDANAKKTLTDCGGTTDVIVCENYGNADSPDYKCS